MRLPYIAQPGNLGWRYTGGVCAVELQAQFIADPSINQLTIDAGSSAPNDWRTGYDAAWAQLYFGSHRCR